MSLILYKSNRIEELAKALASTIRAPLDSPLAPEIIVVQSLGMRRWLSLELANQHGICANCQFPFANKFVDEIFKRALPPSKQNGSFDRATMTWRIMKFLPPLLSLPALVPVQNYVRAPSADLKLFQLAEKIASVFDQYIVFRPRMILDWERGADDDWQALLWRELVRGGRNHHQAAQAEAFAALLKNEKRSLASDEPERRAPARPVGLVPDEQRAGQVLGAPSGLPQRVSIFGISSLPPFYVELFGALAKQIEVHIFLLDPTKELWAHIISDTEEDRMRRRLKNPNITAADLHTNEKNSLLASLGKTGRDFQDLILDLEPDETHELYVEPSSSRRKEAHSNSSEESQSLLTSAATNPENMLSALQADIFHLRDPQEKRPVSPEDNSIQIHSCHSPMREMEVLHDQLLALFEQSPLLTPRDIVVMMPDVTTYAPFIEAVFGSPEDPQKQIPFTIADRGLRAENSIADTFLRILELARSRFGASSVLEILESSCVQRRFDMSESNLETIRVWVERTGIRWGIDAAHRKKLGLPALEQNTWRTGLRRLLLGYALPARGEQLFANVLPYDEVEGSFAQTLGNFADFAEKLFILAEQFEQSRTMRQWQELFLRILDNFFAVDAETESELHILRKTLGSLQSTTNAAEFDGTVTGEVMLAYLTRLLSSEESVSGFISGKVTFCALRPMRSVPFKVVCLAGMNDGSYPRPQKNIGFDKMAEKPETGDRSTRHEDRYLFLEAILSAREVFYVSYVGQSVRDNSPIPPSVLVSELLDYLERGFEISKTERGCVGVGDQAQRVNQFEAAAADAPTPHTAALQKSQNFSDHVVTKHRLQAFSTSYFSKANEKLWSYSEENCAASRASLQERVAPPPFLPEKLSEPTGEWRTVELDSLVKFFSNPAEFLLRHRLGIQLRDVTTLLEETEILEMDPMTKHRTRDFFAEKKLAGMTDERAVHILREGGHSALGTMGECHSRQFAAEVKTFTDAVQAHTSSNALPEISLRQTIGSWELTGTLRDIYPQHLLRHRCTEIKSRDILRIWIHHLALNLIKPCSIGVLIGLDKKLTFGPADNSAEIMQRLLEIYWDGLRAPLKFFPKASFTFAERKLQTGKPSKVSPLAAATNDFYGNDFTEGEIENPYLKLCFQHAEDVLDQEFEKLAEHIFAPILDRMTEEDL